MTRLKNYTLIIIDLQSEFAAACGNKPLINNVKKEIEHAKKLNNHIMFVRYSGAGRIIRSLKEAVKHYDNVSVITKQGQDGWREVLASLPKRNHLRFCGVNTDQCVYDTVCSIAKRYDRKIEVVANGCATYDFNIHNTALKFMGRRKRVKIDRKPISFNVSNFSLELNNVLETKIK
jgi:nicotinamidase-related amidase